MTPTDFDFRADLAEIERHNARRNPASKTWIHTDELIDEFGAESVARNVLAVQLCAWASENFHEPLRLPSRGFARQLVLHQIECGSVFVLVRSREPWMALVPELKSQPIILTAHTLTAHLSRGNLGDGWNLVAGAIRRTEG